MNKTILFLLLSSYLSPMHAMEKNVIKYDHGFSDEDAMAMNKDPKVMIEHIQKAVKTGWKDGFTKTYVFDYSKAAGKEAVIRIHKVTGVLQGITENDFDTIKSGNYTYNPHGVRYIPGRAGVLILGTSKASAVQEVLEYQYKKYKELNKNKLDAETEYVAQAEAQNAANFIIKTQGINALD